MYCHRVRGTWIPYAIGSASDNMRIARCATSPCHKSFNDRGRCHRSVHKWREPLVSLRLHLPQRSPHERVCLPDLKKSWKEYVMRWIHVLCTVVGSQLHVQGGWECLSKPLVAIV